ncbi:hypothetical protein DPMN_121884 [Dreissena polymorpha]|uniref:Uncharacterized protein n=1 Tax=Dreissena polymorpha TaxID=45954 RepID=A0A9D4GRH4_DREPO|nr:hypothetical protein DPMN_121884 [Dreissena polymorpha]
MSSQSSRNRSPAPHMMRVNFDPLQAFTTISGVGPKLVQAIIHVRETAGNLETETLDVLIRRSLSKRGLYWLHFAANPSLVAESTASENEDFVDWTPQCSAPYRNRDQVKAELTGVTSHILALETDITARWEELQMQMKEPLPSLIKPPGPQRLLTTRVPVVAEGFPNPSEHMTYLTSRRPAPVVRFAPG